MAPIGFALAFIPEKIWDPLSPSSQTQLQDWLLTINERVYPNNNWHFFRVSSAPSPCASHSQWRARSGSRQSGSCQSWSSALTRVGRALPGQIRRLVSGGWMVSFGPSSSDSANVDDLIRYSDGPTQQRDYYVTFAIHYYSLIFAKLVSTPHSSASAYEALRRRAEVYRTRAALIAQDYIHFFDPKTGTSIPFGRSLTYRFACVSFWGALAFAEVELPRGLTWGVVRGVVLRNFRWWFGREEWLNGDGTMSIGWAYTNLNMAEAYNSPGTP